MTRNWKKLVEVEWQMNGIDSVMKLEAFKENQKKFMDGDNGWKKVGMSYTGTAM